MIDNPYDPAITDIESRIDHLRNTLDVLKELRAQAGVKSEQSISVSSASVPDNTAPPLGVFAGMTIAEAATKYLEMAGREPKTTDEIATALVNGGLKHASIDFPTTLRSTLAPREEFLRINDVWALTEWHPELNKGNRPTKRLNLEQRIVKAMGSEPGSVWLPRRMAVTLNANLNSVQSVMSNMAQNGKLFKAPRGYSLRDPKARPKAASVAVMPTLKGALPEQTVEQDGTIMCCNLAEYVLKVHGPRLPMNEILVYMKQEGWTGYGSNRRDYRSMHEILKRNAKFCKVAEGTWELADPSEAAAKKA